MGDYIKSYSNYVIKEKHQSIDSGNIYERDITTIGGVNKFTPGQTPIYKSSNFIISVNESDGREKIINSDEFTNWTLDDVNNVEEASSASEKVFKNVYYKLKDFAYYGSCSELVRASITDIISKYPGELFVPNVEESGIPLYVTSGDTMVRIGGEKDLILVDNPFKIDLHSRIVSSSETELNPLRYLNELTKDKFIGIIGGEELSIESVTLSESGISQCPNNNTLEITIKYINGKSIIIYAYIGDNKEIFYLTDAENKGFVIARPKSKYLTEFYNNLDEFESILMNKDTNPKYTSSFEVITESDFGYATELRSFTYPTTFGGYNIATNGSAFEAYIDDINSYAMSYDEIFSDNLYRSMTHESIKNFDWTFTREFEQGDEDEYVIGGTKMQKIIRLFGREFDNIKRRIDEIHSYYNISYNEGNTTPEEFIYDLLINDGWDIKSVLPFDNNCEEFKNLTFKPYEANSVAKKAKRNVSKGRYLHTPIKYTSDKEYSLKEAKTTFLRNLKMCSKHILREKGTISGVESVLSFFGLENGKDYEIKEYSSVTNGIDGDDKEDIINFNKKKTIMYLNDNSDEYVGLPVKEFNNKLYPYFSYNREIDGSPYYQMYGGWLNKQHKLDNDNNIISRGENIISHNETYTNIIKVNTLFDLLSIPQYKLTDKKVVYVNNIDGEYGIIDGILNEIKLDNDNKKYMSFSVRNGTVKIGSKIYSGCLTVTDVVYDLDYLEDETEIFIYIDEGNKISFEGKYYKYNTFEVKTFDSNNDASHYFMLKSAEHGNELSSLGWTNLVLSSNEYKSIKSITDYYNGNNPHSGNLIYDDGYEYMSYFIQLFKTALLNNDFDETCYADDIETIKGLGFKHLAKENAECAYNTCCDNKIHHIGINHEISDDNITNIGEGINKPLISEQIMNTKRVDINFIVDFDCNENNKFKLKYYDYVILNYLSQMLPSTLIININYIKKDDNKI